MRNRVYHINLFSLDYLQVEGESGNEHTGESQGRGLDGGHQGSGAC